MGDFYYFISSSKFSIFSTRYNTIRRGHERLFGGGLSYENLTFRLFFISSVERIQKKRAENNSGRQAIRQVGKLRVHTVRSLPPVIKSSCGVYDKCHVKTQILSLKANDTL